MADTYLEKMRVSEELKAAVRAAKEREGFAYLCDAARWLLIKGAQEAGYLPKPPLPYDANCDDPRFVKDADGVQTLVEQEEP